MITMLKGIPVTLINKTLAGTDPFGRPEYTDVEKTVDNVLVAPVSADDAINQLNLTGRKAVYVLGIPKGNEDEWENQEVRFFNERWRVFGIPTKGIDAMIPLDWNMKVMVERYE